MFRSVECVLKQTSIYDTLGRMTAKTAGGQPVFSNAVYNTTAKPHAMDAATTAEGVFPSTPQAVTYTGFDKVGKVKQGSDSLCYTYGYDRQRILMVEHVGSTTRTKRYVGNCEYVTETAGGNIETQWLTYLTGPTGVFAVVMTKSGTEQVFYILKDNLGSWTTITDEEGFVQQRLSYDAWGNLRDPDTWSGGFSDTPMFDRGFTGHEHLYSFGLVNMNGRMYDPVLSSFLSVDQYVQNPSNSQNFNRYAYCLNNPLRYVDPNGELWWEAAIVGAIIGTFSNAAAQVMSGNVHNGGQFWVAAGIGAISGGLGGAAGFGAGLGAAAWLGEESLIGIGAASGLANGFVSASSAAWMQGASFSKGLWTGIKAGIIGELSGALMGGLEQLAQYHDEMQIFRKGCSQLEIDAGDPIPFEKQNDAFLLQARETWYPDAPYDKLDAFSVEHVPTDKMKNLIARNAPASTTPISNGKVLTGRSKMYFNKNLCFRSAKTLFYSMGHEFVHVSQFAELKGFSSTILDYVSPGGGSLYDLLDSFAYSYETSIGNNTPLNSFSKEILKELHTHFSDIIPKINYIYYPWTIKASYKYPF